MTVDPDYNDLAYSMAGVRKRNPFDQRRALAQKLQMQSMDTSPIDHPLQGVARLAQALAGAYGNYKVDQDEKEAGTALAAKIAEAGKEQDPAKRLSAYSALDPSVGLRYSAQSAADEVKLKKQRDSDAEAAGFLLGGGGTQQAGGGAPGNAIAGIESGGRYDAVGPVANQQGHRAYGKYQVLDPNIGPWTQEILGKAMTPQEFLANPQAQDAVFKAKFGQYQQQYGSPEAASRAWFAGPGGMNNPNAKDVLGTTVQGYGQKFAQAYGSGANLPQGSADASGNALPPQSGGDAGAQYEAAARRAYDGKRPDIALKYMEKATAAREEAAKRDQNRTIQHVDLGDSVGILDPRTGTIIQRIPKAAKPGAEGAGAFGGTGMDAQARSALVQAAQDPAFVASPKYAAAHQFLSQPRQQFDESRGVMVTLPPADLSAFPVPTFRAGQQAPQGQPEGMPQQLGDPSLQAAQQPPGMPPAPSPSVVAGPTMQAGPQPAPAPPQAAPVVTPIEGLPTKPLTESQAKAYGFSQRMATANTLLDELAIQGTSAKGRFLEALPGGIGNYQQSPEYQRFEQAKRNFMNAQLRDESGAVIGPTEFMSADKQYFPQPGQATNKELLAQMAENRRQVVEAMMIKANILKPGQRYEPPKAQGSADAPQGGVDLRKKYGLD